MQKMSIDTPVSNKTIQNYIRTEFSKQLGIIQYLFALVFGFKYNKIKLKIKAQVYVIFFLFFI